MSLRRDPSAALEWQQRSQQTARENQTKRKPLPRKSKKQVKRDHEFSAAKREYLTQNPLCAVCLEGGLQTPAFEVHHRKGKLGPLLCNAKYFLSVCRPCHDIIENNPTLARGKGWKVSRHSVSE